MTGHELLAKLQAMSPEQLKLQIFTCAEDVGRWRETEYYLVDRIYQTEIPQDDETEVAGLVVD